MKVLLIDPCFDDRGISNGAIPLSIGLVASYLKKEEPDSEIQIYKSVSKIIDILKNDPPEVLGVCNYMWNTNLGLRFAKMARELHPEMLIVFGGPEVSPEPVNKKEFIEKYQNVDLMVEREGEISFLQIIRMFKQVNRDRDKLVERIEELGNCFLFNQEGVLRRGPVLGRVIDFDEIPSPYTTGMLDHFLSDVRFQPLIQTNRGCPYTCIFCQEGNKYYSKVRYHSLEYVEEELRYIADRVDPEVGLFIVDSNWGMYAQDIEIAKILHELQETHQWPMAVNATTGKSQLPRIVKVAEMLRGAMPITNSVQTMNDDVLKIIKRKNLVNIQDKVDEIDEIQEPEFILPLPGETKETFIKGLGKLLDTKGRVRFTVYPALLLNDSQMNDEETIQKYQFDYRYRQHQNLMRMVAGEFVCETEKTIVGTSTMSIDDVLYCRTYAMLLDTLLRSDPLTELWKFLRERGIPRSLFTERLFKDVSSAGTKIQEAIGDFRRAFVSEHFPDEDSLITVMKDSHEAYQSGEKGGDLLRYSMSLWIDSYSEMMDWIFETLDSFLENSKDRDLSLSLKRYLNHVYYDKANEDTSEKVIDLQSEYDFLRWSQDKSSMKLEDFQKNRRFRFSQTSLSSKDRVSQWRSFGFYRPKGYAVPREELTRIYLGRMRREIIA